jgi:hypothetical protein
MAGQQCHALMPLHNFPLTFFILSASPIHPIYLSPFALIRMPPSLFVKSSSSMVTDTTSLPSATMIMTVKGRKTKPSFEEFVGAEQVQFGKLKSWEALYPIREQLNELNCSIKDYLEKYSDPVPKQVIWSGHMIGSSKQSAKPTVVFCSMCPVSRRKVRKVIKASEILIRYPGFQTAESNRPLNFPGLIPLPQSDSQYPLSLPLHSQQTKSTLDEFLKYSDFHDRSFTLPPFLDKTKSAFGLCPFIHLNSSNLTYPKFNLKPGTLLTIINTITGTSTSATVGGIVASLGKTYIMTVAHALVEDALFSSWTDTGNQDYDFDMDESEDENEEGSDGESDDPSCTTDSSTELKGTKGRLVDADLQKSQLPVFLRACNPEDHDDDSMLNALLSTTGDLRGLDYALISCDPFILSREPVNVVDYTPNSGKGCLERIVIRPPVASSPRTPPRSDILVLTGRGGVQEGQLVGTSTFITCGVAQEIQEMWTVKFCADNSSTSYSPSKEIVEVGSLIVLLGNCMGTSLAVVG